MEKHICSVQDFLNVVFEQSRRSTRELYYRGQADCEWSLLPSLCDRPKGSYSINEHKLVTEFIRIRPEEFEHIGDSFNVLAKMQHFRLRTRLLDVTTNPLVALFFACFDNKNENKDGEVFIFNKASVYTCDDPVVRVISSCYIPTNIGSVNMLLAKLREKNIITDFEARAFPDFVSNLGTDQYFVKPKIFTERQNRQGAAFILFENERDLNDLNHIKYKYYIFDYKNDAIKDIGYRIILNAQRKEEILWELDKLGINEMFLFPELQYTASYLNNRDKGNVRAERS